MLDYSKVPFLSEIPPISELPQTVCAVLESKVFVRELKKVTRTLLSSLAGELTKL